MKIGDNGERKLNKITTIISVALSSLIFTGCAVIQPGERAVKVTLGKMDNKLVQPGLVFFNPMIDDFHPYSVKQVVVEDKATPLTSDQQPITLEYKVMFRIPEDKVTTLYSQYNGDPFTNLVAPRVQEAFRQVVAQHKADAASKNLTSVKDQVLAMVRKDLGNLVDVVDIPVTHFELPEKLQAAIEEKQKMEQSALQKSYELDRAKKEAEITIAKARADAEAIKLQTQALQKSPQLIELERVKKWDGHLPQIVGGGDKGSLSTFVQMMPQPQAKTEGQ